MLRPFFKRLEIATFKIFTGSILALMVFHTQGFALALTVKKTAETSKKEMSPYEITIHEILDYKGKGKGKITFEVQFSSKATTLLQFALMMNPNGNKVEDYLKMFEKGLITIAGKEKVLMGNYDLKDGFLGVTIQFKNIKTLNKIMHYVHGEIIKDYTFFSNKEGELRRNDPLPALLHALEQNKKEGLKILGIPVAVFLSQAMLMTTYRFPREITSCSNNLACISAKEVHLERPIIEKKEENKKSKKPFSKSLDNTIRF